jgi:hypothetical protein
MRNASPAIATWLADSGHKGIAEADLVVWHVKTLLGAPATFAFWSEHDTQTIPVMSPFSGAMVNYDFEGQGALLSMGETPRSSDLSIRRKSLTMSAIHPGVSSMWLNHDMRLAQVAIFQAALDPESMNLIEALLEFVGELNGAPKEVAAAGGESGVKFDCVSDTRQLTRGNAAKRSDAHQRSRSNDGFHQYIGVAGDWLIPFGQ